MNNSLHIDPVLLREAERQARLKNVNLSEVVEAFIRKFVNHPEEEKKIIRVTPFIERLGVELDLPAHFDEKEAYRKHLEEKYQ